MGKCDRICSIGYAPDRRREAVLRIRNQIRGVHKKTGKAITIEELKEEKMKWKMLYFSADLGNFALALTGDNRILAEFAQFAYRRL